LIQKQILVLVKKKTITFDDIKSWVKTDYLNIRANNSTKPLTLKNRFLYNLCGLGLEWRDEMKTTDNDNRRISLCISQKVFDYLDINDKELLYHLSPHIRIFGRFKPTGKARVVEMLQKSSGHIVAYCGDGGNDVAAAAQAHVGVALIGSMAACDPNNQSTSKKGGAVLFAPFVSKSRDLLNCLRLIREGRAVLANNLCVLRWLLIVNCLFILVAKVYILVNGGFTHCNYFLIAEAILTPFVATLLARSKPPNLPGLDIYTHGEQAQEFKKASENDTLWKPTPPLLPGYGPEVRLLTVKNIFFLFIGISIVTFGYFLLICALNYQGFKIKMDINSMDLSPIHLPAKGDNTLTSTWIIYAIACAYICTLLVLNGGSRFRESSYRNFGLTGFLFFAFSICIIPLITVNSPLNAFWRLNTDQFNFYYNNKTLGQVTGLNQLWDFGRPIFKGDISSMVKVENKEEFEALSTPWITPPFSKTAGKLPDGGLKAVCSGGGGGNSGFLKTDEGVEGGGEAQRPAAAAANGDSSQVVKEGGGGVEGRPAATSDVSEKPESSECSREGCDNLCLQQWEGDKKRRCYVAKWVTNECTLYTEPLQDSQPAAGEGSDPYRYLARHDRLSHKLEETKTFSFDVSGLSLYILGDIALVFILLIILQLLMA